MPGRMDMAVTGDIKRLFFSDNAAKVPLGPVLIIVIAVLIAYINSIRCDFQFSDYNVIVNNPAVHSWHGWFETIRHLGIRPLLKLSYTFSWTTGFGVTGFHIFNIAVHGACSVLIYFLSVRCLKSWGFERIEQITFPALFI